MMEDQLEAVSKPSNADHRTREVHESIIHGDMEFMSNERSSKIAKPCDGSFDCPSSAITPKLASVLSLGSFSTFAMGTIQIPLRLLELFTRRITIVSTVGNQRDRTDFWTGTWISTPSTSLTSAGDVLAVEHAKGIP
jgi:hypothetical protein